MAQKLLLSITLSIGIFLARGSESSGAAAGDGGTLKRGWQKFFERDGGDATPKPSAPTRKAPNKPSIPKAPQAHTSVIIPELEEDKALLAASVAEDANPHFRPTMEDGHCMDYYVGSSNTRCPERAYGFFAVYDGHGGRAAVNHIQSNLHVKVSEKLEEVVGERMTLEEAIEAAFLETNQQMEGNEDYKECGATVVSALFWPVPGTNDREMYISNCGDARAVVAVVGEEQPIITATPIVKGHQQTPNKTPTRSLRMRNTPNRKHMTPVKTPQKGKRYAISGERLSVDHKPDFPSEQKRISDEGGWVMMGRINGTLAVSRALGDWGFKSAGLSAMPAQSHIRLTPRHRFVILASDGLWDVVGDTEAVQAVAHLRDGREMATLLVEMALKKGSTDNVSVMVIRLQE